MWGNALGWSISAVWVLLVSSGLGYLNYAAQSVSSRTEFSADANNADQIELPVPPQTVLAGMTGSTGAGPIYRRAIEQYRENSYAYDQFARIGRIDQIEKLPAFKTLAEATSSASADIFASHPADIVNYENEKQPLTALVSLANGACHAALLIDKQQPAEALKLYEAVFALGQKLYQERLCYAELDAGLTMMAQGSTMIGKNAEATGDKARAERAKQFDQSRKLYVNQRIFPALRVIGSADQATLERHAGDVFYFARHAGDRMWRVEAILKLGRYRYNAGRIGDQRSTGKAIRELLNDPDPVIKTAAAAARDLTAEQYRMLR